MEAEYTLRRTKSAKKELIRKDFHAHWFAYLLILPVLQVMLAELPSLFRFFILIQAFLK